MIRSTVAIVILAAAVIAQAAQAAQPAISPAKQELIQNLVNLMSVDNMGITMLQDPVANALGQARVTLQSRVPAERHEAALRDIAADAKKFMDEAAPIVRTSAQKHIPSTVVPLLAEKFTEDELRQIIAMMESPVKRKFEAMIPDLKKALGEKIAADTGSTINPKLHDLTQRIGTRLRTEITP